jgi:uncharacterized membrane protein
MTWWGETFVALHKAAQGQLLLHFHWRHRRVLLLSCLFVARASVRRSYTKEHTMKNRFEDSPLRVQDKPASSRERPSANSHRQANSTGPSLASRIAKTGVIAAIYAALTVLTLTLLGGLAFGPVQFRLSEAACVLALFFAEAVPGLTIGCALANLMGIALNGSGALGLLDVVGGSAATFIGAWWCWRMRSRIGLALLGPVVANALIVAAYLPLILAAVGFYTVPFTDISLAESYPQMYLFGVLTIGLGEALVVYGLGLPLQAALKRGLP